MKKKVVLIFATLCLIVLAGCQNTNVHEAEQSPVRNPYGGLTTVGCGDGDPVCFAFIFDQDDNLVCSQLVPGYRMRPDGFDANVLQCVDSSGASGDAAKEEAMED